MMDEKMLWHKYDRDSGAASTAILLLRINVRVYTSIDNAMDLHEFSCVVCRQFSVSIQGRTRCIEILDDSSEVPYVRIMF